MSSASSPRTSSVRRRAEPRRAVARVADARDRGREVASCARCCTTTACRSPRPSSSRACWRSCGQRDRLPHHRRAPAAGVANDFMPSPRWRIPLPRNALGFTRRDTRAPCRRCVPAAATTPSPPRSSRPLGAGSRAAEHGQAVRQQYDVMYVCFVASHILEPAAPSAAVSSLRFATWLTASTNVEGKVPKWSSASRDPSIAAQPVT